MTSPHIAKSAQSGEWETPPDLFHRLDGEFGPFDMDAAAAVGQYTADVILGRGGKIAIAPPPGAPLKGMVSPSNENILYDAFEHPWHGRVWLNPPYDRKLLPAFVERAVREAQYRNAELVCSVLPSRTGTRWWQEHVIREVHQFPGAYGRASAVAGKADLVRFLPGRVKFVRAGENCALFASVVVVWSR